MLSGHSVLFVDDEDAIRYFGQCAFADAGCAATVAADGREAIQAMETHAVDLAVIDIIMPGKEGIETIIELKRRWPRCKVIAISGGGRIDPDYCLNLARMVGADAVLSKPVSLAEMIGAGETVLSA